MLKVICLKYRLNIFWCKLLKLPLANEKGEPYEYFAVPSLNNPGEHYDEECYASKIYDMINKTTEVKIEKETERFWI